MAERKKGDRPGGNTLQADLYKLVVNSSYGGMIQNKDNHCQMKYTRNRWELCKMINEPQFREAVQLGDIYQVSTSSKKVKQNVPIQLGKFILDYAKMHMVSYNTNQCGKNAFTSLLL